MQLSTLIGPSSFNGLGYLTILSLTRLQIRGSSISQLAFLSKVTSGSNISVFVCECPQILFLAHFLLVVLKWKPPVSNNHHNTQWVTVGPHSSFSFCRQRDRSSKHKSVFMTSPPIISAIICAGNHYIEWNSAYMGT